MRGIHQDTESREVLEARVPIIIVQFQQDVFCNPQRYPNWYGHIIAAVQAERAPRSFVFLNLPGVHDCCETLATQSRWQEYGHELRVVWQSFWAAATKK